MTQSQAELQAALDKSRQERKRAIEAVILQAAEATRDRMRTDPEAAKLAYMMLFGHRLIYWACGKLSELPDVTSPMVQLAHEAQAEHAAVPFDFAETIRDFKARQLPWLEEICREAIARNKTNERRVRALTSAIKEKTIPLPFEELDAPFENGMQHADALLLFGPSAGTAPILRLCAKAYEEAGGRSMTLMGDVYSEKMWGEKLILTAWKNSGDTYGSFSKLFSEIPNFNSIQRPIGMMLVDNLDMLLAESLMLEPRPARLVRALGLLRQFQVNHPMAMIIAINTDNDQPAGMRPEEVYPPFLVQPPHQTVEIKKSDLAGGFTNLIIGGTIYQYDKVVWEATGKE